jgi:hypothetical protein
MRPTNEQPPRLTLGKTLISVVVVGFVAGGAQRGLAHESTEAMVSSAQQFLNSLDPAARAKAQFTMDDDRRQNWHFVPDKFIKPDGKRMGLAVKEMSAIQRLFAQRLLHSALSHKGYPQSVTIMALEQILHDLENKNPIRDPELYHVCIFGEPAKNGTWAWRFEGHHLSVNVTIIDGHIASVTPSFFGSNPAIVKDGPHKGLQVQRAEQELARQLVNSLSTEQRKIAILDGKAPRDIVTAQRSSFDRNEFQPPQGIRFDQLSENQQIQLRKLVAEYTSKYRPDVLRGLKKEPSLEDGADVYFAWMGGTKAGQEHYYRVQTPTYLFEYDNTQNDANHIHAVWRTFDGDFGVDLLRQHYENSSHHQNKR